MYNNFPMRKRIRLKNYDYSKYGWYFVTICIQNRRKILGNISKDEIKLSKLGELIDKNIKDIEEIFEDIIIDEYVVMPNHIHLIILINSSNKTNLSRIIKKYKEIITKEIGQSIWQRSYYEHIIRNEKEYYKIKEYIQNNIVNWEKDKYF